jgi:hypothetical protein
VDFPYQTNLLCWGYYEKINEKIIMTPVLYNLFDIYMME